MQSVLCRIDQLDKERNFRIQNNLKRHGSFNIKEILRGDIMKAIILIGLSAALYQMAIKSIQLSIQSLESSYNFNLFIGGIANICGFLTASKYVMTKFISLRQSQKEREALFYLLYCMVPSPCSFCSLFAIRTAVLKRQSSSL